MYKRERKCGGNVIMKIGEIKNIREIEGDGYKREDVK